MNADEAYGEYLRAQSEPPPAPSIDPANALGEQSFIGLEPVQDKPAQDNKPGIVSEFGDFAGTVFKTIGDLPDAAVRGIVKGGAEGAYAAGLIDEDQVSRFRTFMKAASDTAVEEGVEPITAGLTEAFGQMAPSALPVFKGLQLAGVARPLAVLVAEAVGGAFGFNPDEPNLANLVKDNVDQGELLSVVTELMATDPNDPDAINRIRNGIQDLTIGGIFEGLVWGVPKAVRRFKEGKSPIPVGMSIEDVSPNPAQVNMRINQKTFENDIRNGDITPDTPGVDPDEVRAIQANLGMEPAPTTVQHVIPTEADNPNSIINMLYNNTDEVPPPPNGRKWTKAQLAVKLEEDAKAAGRYVEEYNDEARESISDTIVNEAAAALKREGNASDWYNSKLIEMNEQLRKLHPELKDGSVDEGMFKLGLALTSNGTVVGDNLKFAEHVYSVFKKEGRFPDNLASMEAALGGFGKEGQILVKSFQKANRLIDEMGVDDFVGFLNTPITVRELKQLGFGVSRENMDMQTFGSAIFGPKIGAGFYQNLRGNFEPVTFDRWWTASWGRWTGRSPERATAKAQGDQLDRFRAATGKKYANRSAAVTAAKKIFTVYKRNNFQPRTELNKSAQRLAEGSEIKMREDPGGGGERAFMRETVHRAVEKLKELGYNVTPADLQATVWYPEKELHGRLGIGSGRSAPDDYAAAARRLVEERNAGQ